MSNNDIRENAINFLIQDFTETCWFLRHYDTQMWMICRFVFIVYSVLIGIISWLYEYSSSATFNSTSPSIFILLIGTLIGFIILALMVRNRIYTVVCARYINEYRSLFLNIQDIGFQNKVGIFTNPSKPPYFNWNSTDSLFIYLVALLNSILVSLSILFYCSFSAKGFIISIFLFLVIIFAQLLICIRYLKSMEHKKAEYASFSSYKS